MDREYEMTVWDLGTSEECSEALRTAEEVGMRTGIFTYLPARNLGFALSIEFEDRVEWAGERVGLPEQTIRPEALPSTKAISAVDGKDGRNQGLMSPEVGRGASISPQDMCTWEDVEVSAA